MSSPTLAILGVGALLALVDPVRGQLVGKAYVVSDEVAKESRKAFEEAYRDPDEKLRLAAVDRLTSQKHRLIVLCLAKALQDRSPLVRSAAAVRLGLQNPKDAGPVLHRAFSERRNRDTPEVLISVLEAFRAGRRAPPLRELTNSFDDVSKEVQREILRVMAFCRTMDTVEWLAQHLDTPAPENVDSPTNPPGSYWKDKVERWTFWVVDVQRTLHHLTGEEFDEASQVREWKRRGGKILRLKDKKEDDRD